MKLLATILVALALSTSAFGGAGVPPTLPPPGLPYTVGVTPPVVAGFTGIPTTGSAPHTVCFTDQSTGTATAWAWTFGDGGTSTLRDPCHTYTAPGAYTVALNVTCNEGNDDIIRTNYITVAGWPVVTSVSGTISHGSTVTLAGASFGTKATAAPLLWDSFDAGTPGNVIAVGSGSWDEISEMGDWYTSPRYDDDTKHGDTGNSMKIDWSGNFSSCSVVKNGNFSSGFYLDAWVNYIPEPSPPWTRNTKLFLLYGSGNNSYPQLHFGTADCTQNSTFRLAGYPNSGIEYLFGRTQIHNSFKHLQVWAKASSTPGAHDGVLKVFLDGVEKSNTTSFMTADTSLSPSSAYWRQVQLGYYHAHDAIDGCPASTGDSYAYWDNIYIDNTQARVELGNASTYAASTHREIQPASAWANGSITVTLNTGTFAPGTAYLFVTDSTGRTSAGRAVTIVAP